MAHKKEEKRIRRKKYIRKKLRGSSDRPRIFVYKSNRYLSVGVADDSTGKVLISRRTSKDLKRAKEIGIEIGKELKKIKITKSVFDRSGYVYHGRVQAVADGVRESGIEM